MRTLLGAAGSASVAASNMIVAFIVMLNESESIYGFYSFYIVFLAFFGAVSNSLFSTALLYVDSTRGKIEIAVLNVCFCLFSGFLFLLGVYCFLQEFYQSLFISIHALVYLTRWYLRYYKQAELNSNSVVVSDLLYGVLLSLFCLYWYVYGYTSFSFVIFGMVVSLILSMVAIFDRKAFSFGVALWPFEDYVLAFKYRVRYSLPGVVFNEIISNGHVYFMFLVLGATAYAPVAAIMLLYRPVNIVFQTMFQIERPRIRSRIKSNGFLGRGYLYRLIALGFASLAINLLVIFTVMTNFRGELPPLEYIGAYDLILVFSIYNLIRLVRNPLWIFLSS